MSITKSETIPYTAVNNRVVYFCTVREHFILDNYVHASLPLGGWFKMCSSCFSITGEFELFEYSDNIFICIPICYHCFNKLTDFEWDKMCYKETEKILFDSYSLKIFHQISTFDSSLEFSSPSSSDSS